MGWQIGLIAGVLVASTLVVVLLVVFKNKNKVKKSFHNIEKKFIKIKDNQLENKLEKIKKISENNEEYKETYSELNERFVELSTDKIVEIEVKLEQTKSSLQSKGAKDVKEEIKVISKNIDELYKCYLALENDINEITKKERQLREELVPIKESFRLMRGEFLENKDKFYDCQENFEDRLNKIEDKMEEVDKLLVNGIYSEVEEKIAMIYEEVEFYKHHLNKLPELISFSMQILPRRLEKTKERYENLKEEGYPLYNIKMNLVEESTKEKLKEIKQSFIDLEYEGIETDIKKIALDISELDEAMSNEVVAREEYESEVDGVYNKVSQVLRNFLKAKRDTKSISGIFLMEQERLQELDLLENRIQNLNRIKSDLDSYIHSITKKPFTLLNAKMRELNQYVIDTEKGLNNYIGYIKSLKDDSEAAYRAINDFSIGLNTYLNKIYNLNHHTLIDRYEKAVEDTLEMIDDLKLLLETKPINVRLINEKLNKLMMRAETLIKSMQDSEEMAKIAQSIIVFTNKYRSSFSSVNEVLNKAKIHYDSGEFEFAIDQVSEVLEEVHPRAYEEMLKRKGIINE